LNKANRARRAPLQPFPRSIRVGNKRYSIDLIESMLNKGEMAKVFYEQGKIVIGKRSSLNGRRFSKANLRESFFHELVHAILYDMNAHKLNRDEEFVTEFSQRLSQALTKVEFT
jgi:Zn-dependent peptidase ImmA (M78 family)